MLKIGYHAEGHDHLILHYLLCQLLGCDPGTVQARPVERRTGKRGDISGPARDALHRFYYGEWAIAGVLEIDNDGRVDLRQSGDPEDPDHPRHWVHIDAGEQTAQNCRFCQLADVPARTCSGLRAEGFVSGDEWAVIICVPTEAIEAWLLIAKGLTEPDNSLLDAEQRPAGAGMKRNMYGIPRATMRKVKTMALPALQALSDVRDIARYSRSFRLFADQVSEVRPRIVAAAERLGVKL